MKALVNADKSALAIQVKSLTPQLAIYNGTQLSRMKKDNYPLLMVALTELLEATFKFFGVTADESCTDDLAEIILAEFWSFKIEEIALVLRNGKSARYGKIYGKLSAQTVIEWIRAYDKTDRTSACIRQNSNHKDIKSHKRASKDDMNAYYEKVKVDGAAKRIADIFKSNQKSVAHEKKQSVIKMKTMHHQIQTEEMKVLYCKFKKETGKVGLDEFEKWYKDEAEDMKALYLEFKQQTSKSSFEDFEKWQTKQAS